MHTNGILKLYSQCFPQGLKASNNRFRIRNYMYYRNDKVPNCECTYNNGDFFCLWIECCQYSIEKLYHKN